VAVEEEVLTTAVVVAELKNIHKCHKCDLEHNRMEAISGHQQTWLVAVEEEELTTAVVVAELKNIL